MKRRTAKPTMHELRQLGISQSYASELAAGKKVPSLKLAQRIEHTTGYPAVLWALADQVLPTWLAKVAE
jgi:transcriptional regulator with XRE-family HTH domain